MTSKPVLEVITGCMCSGKSEELIRRLHLATIAKLPVKVFKSSRDTRSGDIWSRSGVTFRAIAIDKPAEVFSQISDGDIVIAFDEIQFMDAELFGVVRDLLHSGKRVIVSGLNLDFRGEPFDVTARLMALATKVTVLHAVCAKCNSFDACRSQRLISDGDRIVIGDREYEPRCIECFEPPKNVII